jgi:uncharacterized protein (TIGR03086 family)
VPTFSPPQGTRLDTDVQVVTVPAEDSLTVAEANSPAEETAVTLDLEAVYADAARAAATAIAQVRSVQLGLPTPCDGVTVRQLLVHLVEVNKSAALAGRSLSTAGWNVERSWVGDGGWLKSFTMAAVDARAAWAQFGCHQDRETPWGTLAGDTALGAYISELVVHTWDLCTATGQVHAWDEHVLRVSLDSLHALLPEPRRRSPGNDGRTGHRPSHCRSADFDDAVRISDRAPLIDRVVAWSGRLP